MMNIRSLNKYPGLSGGAFDRWRIPTIGAWPVCS